MVSWLRKCWHLIRAVVSLLLDVVYPVCPGPRSELGDLLMNPRGSGGNQGPRTHGGKSKGLKSHPTASEIRDTRKNGGKTG